MILPGFKCHVQHRINAVAIYLDIDLNCIFKQLKCPKNEKFKISILTKRTKPTTKNFPDVYVSINPGLL
jgi:hypothetical protein